MELDLGRLSGQPRAQEERLGWGRKPGVQEGGTALRVEESPQGGEGSRGRQAGSREGNPGISGSGWGFQGVKLGHSAGSQGRATQASRW